jgi:pyruvate/2-oxoglutarate dehydrogenase complex dihydrolipoamide acyltransferase (E2) component
MWISRNLELGQKLNISSWRQIAVGSWRSYGDPTIYGLVELDVGPALKYLRKLEATSGTRLTITHFMGRAAAEVLRRHPEINSVIRFGSIYPRKTVDVFLMVASDRTGEDLSGMCISAADQKSVVEIAQEVNQRAQMIRDNKDASYRGMKSIFAYVPGVLSAPLMKLVEFVLYELNLWSPALGLPRKAFGSVMITNVGALGLDVAWGALVPFARAPLLLTLGTYQDSPGVKDGQLTVIQQLKLGVTIDHRIVDGVQASHMSKTLKQIFANPEQELGLK